MVLDNIAIGKIISERPNNVLLKAAQDYSKKLLMHIEGVGLEQYIEQVNSFEKKDKVEIRKRYAVSNKALFSRIHRPIDKVFSAKGGSAFYNTSEDNTNKLKVLVGNIVYGYTLKQWLEIFWMPAMAYDPMGLVMMEIDGNNNIYPTYKSVLDIHEYKLNGRNVEYVIFKLAKTDYPVTADQDNQIYRVVDDMFDKLVYVANGVCTDVQGQTYPNYFNRVPASIISNIYSPVKGMFISTDDKIVELADQFLREGSVKNIYKNYFGFPRAWQYQSACVDCGGEGTLAGNPCNACKGSGVNLNPDVSQIIQLPVPKSRDEPLYAPHVAGYITPDIKGWDAMTMEMEALEDIMFETLWGTHQADDNKRNETATGKFIDIQPVNDKLNKFSDASEMMETFIINLVAEFVIGQSYKGASITYGRRFMVESTDEIWDKFLLAVKSGAPTTALYDLFNDYLQSRYSSNAMEMVRLLKLAKIEPLPFVKYADFGHLQTFPDVLLRKKFWFEEWLCRKTDADIMFGDLTKLQDDFDTFCKERDVEIEGLMQLNPTLDPNGKPVVEPEKVAA